MVSLSLKDGIQTLLSPGLIQSSMEVLSQPAAVEGCRLHPSQSGAVDHTCFHLLMPVGWHQVEHSFTTNQPHIGHLLVCVIELKEKRGCIVLSTHDCDSLTFELNQHYFVRQQRVPNHLDFWLHDMPCQCVSEVAFQDVICFQ
jgi:hypothetical protein